MATLIAGQFASESQHWYARDGSPAYEVVGKNGKTRPATLRDARELGLVPSVTSILAVEAAPGLVNWKIQQALLSAMTLPQTAGESADDFMRRCLEDSRAQAKKAAERGTYLHGILETTMRDRFLVSAEEALSEDDFPIIDPVLTWLHTNFSGFEWRPERSFASLHGFGGKIDLYGESPHETVLIDYKFKEDIVEGKRLAYDNHCTQLAAYSIGLNLPYEARCINLFVSSSVPGLIVPHEWKSEEIKTGWEVFSHLLAIWKLRRGL